MHNHNILMAKNVMLKLRNFDMKMYYKRLYKCMISMCELLFFKSVYCGRITWDLCMSAVA